MTKARSDLILDAPFFGAIVLRLRMVELENDPQINTFAVDGYSIFYDLHFADNLSVDLIKGVLVHEVLHVACLHHTRMHHRNPELWNMACDYAINPIVKKNGFKLPKDALLDSNYEGMHAEKIYDLLLQDPDIQEAMRNNPTMQEALEGVLEKSGGLGGQKGFDKILPPPKDKKETSEQDAKALTTTGMIAAKNAGKIPGDLEGIIEACQEAQVDWKETIRHLLTRRARGDQVWSRPNKRLLDSVGYLPHFEEDPVGQLVISIDSSASVDDRELNIFGSEIQEIMIDNGIEKLTVLWVDTKVQDVQEFEMHDDIVLHVRGRGGTRFEPAFDWVEERDMKPDAFIYFTDGEASYPENVPDYPVIWCITHPTLQADWGDTINLKF